jgi:hypothetical protein
VLGGGRQQYVESPIPNPPGLVIDQIRCLVADLLGTPHELEEHAQAYALGGFAHTRGDVNNAECILARSVPVG